MTICKLALVLAKHGVALPTNNMSTHTMKVTTFSSTSDERWNISSPEVFPYFLLPPVDDTGAFKDGENALWLLWHLCFQTACAIRCFIVTPQMKKPRLTFDIYDYKHLIVQSGKWSHLLNFLKEVENTNSSSLSFISYSFFITIINVVPLMMMIWWWSPATWWHAPPATTQTPLLRLLPLATLLQLLDSSTRWRW